MKLRGYYQYSFCVSDFVLWSLGPFELVHSLVQISRTNTFSTKYFS